MTPYLARQQVLESTYLMMAGFFCSWKVVSSAVIRNCLPTLGGFARVERRQRQHYIMAGLSLNEFWRVCFVLFVFAPKHDVSALNSASWQVTACTDYKRLELFQMWRLSPFLFCVNKKHPGPSARLGKLSLPGTYCFQKLVTEAVCGDTEGREWRQRMPKASLVLRTGLTIAKTAAASILNQRLLQTPNSQENYGGSPSSHSSYLFRMIYQPTHLPSYSGSRMCPRDDNSFLIVAEFQLGCSLEFLLHFSVAQPAMKQSL